MLSISATSPLGKMHLAKHTAQSLSRGEVFIICMNCYNRIKALKERQNIAPGAAQQTRGMKITIITAEQRASFEMKGRNEAGELRLN